MMTEAVNFTNEAAFLIQQGLRLQLALQALGWTRPPTAISARTQAVALRNRGARVEL
mgnify:CR=1 FL=1